jgi:fucose 4-O-acetylase-like acetyltransferase
MSAEAASDRRTRLADLAARTPASRDRYMDFLRALSILVVVVGHWLMGVVYWQDGLIGTWNVVAVTPVVWVVTWLVMVMPIFFFVGGFSNLTSYHSHVARGESTWAWIRVRLGRLLRPSLVFVAVWVVIQVALHLFDVGRQTTPFLRGVKPPGATLPFGPIWFVAAYAAFLLLAPALIRLHRRFGVAVPIAMVAGAVVVDAVGFAGKTPGVRWVNAALVWLVPHQLGFFYAEGRLQRLPRRFFVALSAVGLAGLILLTNPWVFGEAGQRWFPGIGHYPRSLIGTGSEPISNAYPPTLCLLAVGFWLLGLAMLARRPVTRWLQRERPWRRVVGVNSVIMTLFLWHMTAFLIAVLLLWPLGLGSVRTESVGWWLERPVWIAASAVILVALVRIFARYEHPRTAGSGPPRSELQAATPA